MPKPWLKNTIRIAAFLLALLLAVLAAGHVLMPTSNRYLSGYTAGGIWGEDFNTVDVLVMGDSNAAQGITPMQWYGQYGITGFTYAAGWSSVYNVYYGLRQILEEQSPRVVVLCTSTAYSKKDTETWWEAAVGDIGDELLPLLRYHDEWKVLTVGEVLDDNDYTWRDVNKGFTPITDIAPYAGGDYMYDTGKKEPLAWPVRFYLGRIADLCAENDIALVLITVPTTNWNLARHNGIEAWAEGRGVPYFDYNLPENDPGIDWAADSADGGTHLNVLGAAKATAALGAWLQAQYALPDHRGQPGYETWDKDLTAWQVQAAEQQAEMQALLLPGDG